jgi:uncharacterized membrane protein YfcA
VLSVGAFVGGELYPSWMHFFQALLLPYLSFIALFTTRSNEEDTALAWWPELTALPTSIFAEMRRLARDETPFPLAMQPKVTALVW